jgi:cell surface protein SprA
VYVIDQQVIISERFAPLIGINVRTVNRITARLEYNKERNVALQLSNHQIQELANKDIVMSIGFTRNNFRLPFRVQGRDVVLKNDLTFRCDATVRDSKTVQRTTDEGSTVTNGSTTVQVKPTVNYVLNQRLNIQLYYEQMVNKPKISTSFPRTTSSLGFNLRYNLGQ